MFNGLIRELKKEDVPTVEKIYDLYWSDDFRGHISERLKAYVEQHDDIAQQDFKYFVAEENGEVVGVASMRKAPEHMKKYATTSNPAEFYVIAVKDKRRGIGTALRNARIEVAKQLGYTEVLLFGGDTHQDTWPFHDNSDFKRVGEAKAPNGESGQIWQMILK